MTDTGIFYGTGAAEGVPSPFCDCPMCNYAREHGGKDVRKRSCFRLGRNIMIDMGPDIFTQALQYGSMCDIEHVLITHTHDDHFDFTALGLMNMATHLRTTPVNFYFSEEGYRFIELLRDSEIAFGGTLRGMEKKGIYAFHKLKYFETYSIGEYEVTPIRGNHGGNMAKERSANYVLKAKDGTKMLYGMDTGLYEEETLDFMKNQNLDIWISECTFGNLKLQEEWNTHLCADTFLELLDTFEKNKTIRQDTKIYLSHINQCHTAPHEKLQGIMTDAKPEYQIVVAYDGLEIPISRDGK